MVSYTSKSSQLVMSLRIFMNAFLSIGAFLGLTAVIIGAFGAHGLENTLTTHALARYNTGVEYQFYHVAAIFFIILYDESQPRKSRFLHYSGIAFIIGIIVFSGSLYLYALTGISKFGMITPIGGLAFIVGWFLLIIYGLRKNL